MSLMPAMDETMKDDPVFLRLAEQFAEYQHQPAALPKP